MNKFLKYFCYPIHLWTMFCEKLSWTKIDSYIFAGGLGCMSVFVIQLNWLLGTLSMLYTTVATPLYFCYVFDRRSEDE